MLSKMHQEHMAKSDSTRAALEVQHGKHHAAADKHRGAHAAASVNGEEMDNDADFDQDADTDEDGD